MAARLLVLIGIVAAVLGLSGTVLYLFQPWRTCPYDDSPASCAMLPGDAAVMAAAFALLCFGVVTVVLEVIFRARRRSHSSTHSPQGSPTSDTQSHQSAGAASEFLEFDLDGTAPFMLQDYLFDRDFLIVDREWPDAAFWDSFPFESRGVDFRRDPLQVPGWKAFEPHVAKVRYLGISVGEDMHEPDLTFIASATSLVGLAASGSRTTVDVSHLSIASFHGDGTNLTGLFDLPTLTDLFLTDRMPSVSVSSPLEKVIINHLDSPDELDRILTPSSVLDLRVLGGGIDLVRLTRFVNLESLTLSEMTYVAGTESLLRLPRLRSVMLADCIEIANLDAFDSLANLHIVIAGENVFDENRRKRLTNANRSRWDFPDLKGSSDGTRMYLVHPGMRRPMTAADGDIDAGPGAEVTPSWERLSRKRQADRLKRFAEAFRQNLVQRGASSVTDLASGESWPLSSFDVIPFTSDEEAAYLSFTDPAGIELGRVNENFWLGALVRASRPPEIAHFK